MPGKRLWIIAALAWLAHWAAAAVPGVRLGAVTVPGFAAAVDVSLLAALALVIWLMVSARCAPLPVSARPAGPRQLPPGR